MTNVQLAQTPDILPSDWVTRAQKLSTTLFSDVTEFPVEMSYTIKPCNPKQTVVGSAVTINVDDGDNLAVHKAMYESKPGHVLVVSTNGTKTTAVIGELMAAAAQALNLNGFIIDGLIRDQLTLSQSSFPVFSLGATPSGPTKNGPGYVNHPIVCGGRKVHPGDFVMGDADGVIVIPREKVEDALTLAEKKAEYEQKRLENIAQGNIRPDWLK